MKLEKIYGATARQDGLYKIGRNKYELIYGYGVDGENGYNWRRRYRNLPTVEELKTDIEDTVNALTDEKILKGFSWKFSMCLTKVKHLFELVQSTILD